MSGSGWHGMNRMPEHNRELKLLALRLSALKGSDQRWLLRQLPLFTAQQLREELRQLQQLGIANGQDLYRQLVGEQPTDLSSFLRGQQPHELRNRASRWLQQQLSAKETEV